TATCAPSVEIGATLRRRGDLRDEVRNEPGEAVPLGRCIRGDAIRRHQYGFTPWGYCIDRHHAHPRRLVCLLCSRLSSRKMLRSTICKPSSVYRDRDLQARGGGGHHVVENNFENLPPPARTTPKT